MSCVGGDRMTKTFARRMWCLIAAALIVTTASPSCADVNEVRFARQLGLGYLQFHVMQEKRLVEQHALRLGLGKVTTRWVPITSNARGSTSGRAAESCSLRAMTATRGRRSRKDCRRSSVCARRERSLRKLNPRRSGPGLNLPDAGRLERSR